MATTLDPANIVARLVSHAQRVGGFERVIGHEPKASPGKGLTVAFWLDQLDPIPASGLASVSVRLAFVARLYMPMLAEPGDGIDIDLLNALDRLFKAYCGDFDLGHSARSIDLFGADGAGLNAKAGYINIDSTLYRVVNITIPVIVNDAWSEGA